MLSTTWNEVARRNAWTCLSCSARASSQGLIGNTSRSAPPNLHQRRHSSSKPLAPPKNESRTITAPSEAPAETATPAVEGPKRTSARLRRKTRETARDPIHRNNGPRVHIPSVPSTQHLRPLDIHVASFFSIHRPISVTTSVPPPSSDSVFSSIFSPRERPKHQPQDVIYTVSSAIDNIEDITTQSQKRQLSQEESDLRDVVIQSSVSNAEIADTQHLDGAQPQTIHINIQELAKRFQPFKAPPAPVPMGQARSTGANNPQLLPAKRKTVRKSYSTRLLITENIHPNGHTTYETRASPLVEEPAGEHLEHVKLPPISRQPFLKRMLERQRRLAAWREGGNCKEVWRAISVKRQRKLKMKKHKYKKLMRRTRNLRRKLDKN